MESIVFVASHEGHGSLVCARGRMGVEPTHHFVRAHTCRHSRTACEAKGCQVSYVDGLPRPRSSSYTIYVTLWDELDDKCWMKMKGTKMQLETNREYQ